MYYGKGFGADKHMEAPDGQVSQQMEQVEAPRELPNSEMQAGMPPAKPEGDMDSSSQGGTSPEMLTGGMQGGKGCNMKQGGLQGDGIGLIDTYR